MSEIEVTDRYGGNYPDPATMCQGDCEGIGRYPVMDSEHETRPGELRTTEPLTRHEQAEIERIKAGLGISEDGWYFVVCPDCGGTGQRPAEAPDAAR